MRLASLPFRKVRTIIVTIGELNYAEPRFAAGGWRPATRERPPLASVLLSTLDPVRGRSERSGARWACIVSACRTNPGQGSSTGRSGAAFGQVPHIWVRVGLRALCATG